MAPALRSSYLFSLPPQHVANKENTLSFPFDQRWGMAFWNLAFLSDRRFVPDPAQSAAVNRGAYLATALGHCGQCHTPRNLAYGLESGRKFAGDVLMRSLPAFSPRPTRKAAVPPPDRWQKRWRTVCNI